MPVETGSALLQPAKPQPKQPTVQPPPQFPIDPANPVTQAHGMNFGTQELNNRVQAVVDAHRHSLGFDPSPGLTYDVVRSNVPPNLYSQLFPKWISDPKSAQIESAVRKGALLPTPAGPDAAATSQDAVEGVGHAIRNGTYADYLKQHADLIEKGLQDPSTRDSLLSAISQGLHPQDVIDAAEQAARTGNFGEWAAAHRDDLARVFSNTYTRAKLVTAMQNGGVNTPAQVLEESVFPLKTSTLGKIIEAPSKPVEQVSLGLALGPPILAYEEGKATYESVKQKSLAPLAHTNVELARQMVTGFKRDVTDPRDNIGNLALDILALASAGAGTVARLSAAGRAFSEEGGLAAAGALLHRPAPGTYTFTKGDSSVDSLLSDNALIRQAQRGINFVRQAHLNVKYGEGEAPGGLVRALVDSASSDLIDKATHPLGQFTLEKKLGREYRAQAQVEKAIRDSMLDSVAFASKAAERTYLFDRVLPSVRKSLSAGEQKAIQVLLSDVEGPAKNQVETWRDFHQRMIDTGQGDAEAHTNQLRLLGLAEKVLARKPSKAFQNALDGVQRVASLSEAIKAEKMGLLPETAEGRVARVGQLVRGEELQAKGERVNPQSAYQPYVSSIRHKPISSAFSTRPGPYGIPEPMSHPALNHEFTGYYIKAGDFRTDSTALAAEDYGKTVRTLMLANMYRFLHDASDATKLTRDHIPIRDTRQIPDELRKVLSKVEQGEIPHEDAQALAKQEFESLQKFLFPNETDLSKEELQGVRWVPKGLLGDSDRPRVYGSTNAFKKAAIGANEVARDAFIYLKPNYIMMMLNAGQMALMEEGLTFPANIIRAIRAEHLYGPEEARVLHTMAGHGRSLSYYSDLGKVTMVGRKLSALWHRIAEQTLRTSAVIYWLHRAGHTDAEISDLLRHAHTDDTAMNTLVEASRRGRKAMVQFDNMTYYEREVFKHILFVYPWLRGTAVWSLRTLLEHPIQSDVYAHAGENAEQQFSPELKELPRYMKDLGYFPIGWTHDGKPKVINPGTYNSYSTLAQLAGLAQDPSQSIEDMLGPAASLVVHEVTNRDRYGRAYKTRFLGPLVDQLTGLPQIHYFQKAQAQQNPGPPLNLASIYGLVTQEHELTKGPYKQSIEVPQGFWNSFAWPLLFGGLADKMLDPKAIDARYWEKQPLEARNAHEQKQIQEMIGIQAKAIGVAAPAAVRTAARLSSAFSLTYGQFQEKNGRGPTTKEKTLLDIQTLETDKLISAKVAEQLRGKLKNLPPDETETFRLGLHRNYAYGKQLSTWSDDMKTYVQVANSPLLDSQIRRGVQYGVVDKSMTTAANADPAVLQKYARGFVKFEAHQRTKLDRLRGMNPDDAKAQKLLVESQTDAADVPVKINGHTLPSYPRLALMRLTQTQLQDHITAVSSQSWDSLSSVDKSLLGHNVAPGVSKAWAAFKFDTSKAGLQAQPPGQRTLDAAQKLAVAKQLDADYKLNGAFVKDYLYAQQPRYQRYQYEPIYQHSQNKTLWKGIFDQAQRLDAAHKAGDISQSQEDDAWSTWTNQAEQIIKDRYPSFWRELQPYLKHNPSFLSDLVKK